MYRMVDSGMWKDPWFEDLGTEAKLLFVYLFTNDRTTAAGVFEVTERTMAHETGIDRSRVSEALGELADKVAWWPEHRVVWVKNFYRRQKGNDNFRKSARKAVEGLPGDVREAVCRRYPELSQAGDTHDIPLATGSDTHGHLAKDSVGKQQEQQQHQERVGQEGAAPAGARPPADPPPSPAERKPRTPRQQASDALYERRQAYFAAYCAGVGIDPGSSAEAQHQDRAFRELAPLLKAGDLSPGDFGDLARYARAAYGWRNGRQTPSVAEVIAAAPEWEHLGRPPEPPPRNVRALPNGRAGPKDLSPRDLMGLSDDYRERGL